ncbi:hypothetical protein HDU93_007807 [Gonapodya sp. JEL0774]|nr:hypothetical protein HDU93_007807 [Gonapodya sp. JEL0774]
MGTRGNSVSELCVQRREYATFGNGYDPKFCPYKTLNVGEAASQEEIKKAFFRLAKEHHPDTARSSTSHDRFVAISRAYELVGAPDKRSRYDRERALHMSNASRYGYSASTHNYYPGAAGTAGRRPHASGYGTHSYDPFARAGGAYGQFHEENDYYQSYRGATGAGRARPADAGHLWAVLGAFAVAGVSLTFWHITRMRELVAQSMNLKEREALVYYEESRRRAKEAKGFGDEVLEGARKSRKSGTRVEALDVSSGVEAGSGYKEA